MEKVESLRAAQVQAELTAHSTAVAVALAPALSVEARRASGIAQPIDAKIEIVVTFGRRDAADALLGALRALSTALK